jgi:hypothetical protein
MNRFETAALLRGSITPGQEYFLTHQKAEVLAKHRQIVGIHKPIPQLSKRQAWSLINAIKGDSGDE